MPDNASPARNHRVIFTSLIVVALAAPAITGAAFSGAARGSLQSVLRATGLGRNDAILAEQRRQTRLLARIEEAIGRVQAGIALLKTRFDEEANRNRDAANAPPASRISDNRVADNPDPGNAGRRAPGSGLEFDLGLLRASFDTDAMPTTPGTRPPRPRLHRTGKSGRAA